MKIIRIVRSASNSVDVQLPYANMKVDPRYMSSWYQYEGKFTFSVNGRTLTITRTDVGGWLYGHEDGGWPDFNLRAYLPTEVIPDFTSTVYTYWGLDGEKAPKDVTEVIFHPSVTRIQEIAFCRCKSLVWVTIPDTVTRIEPIAFMCCDSLRYIRLPRNLEFIGQLAFQDCESLQAVFVPRNVTHIGHGAFRCCISLRYLNVPEAIEHIGGEVIYGCDRLLTTVKYISDDKDEGEDQNSINNDEVNAWLMQRYANLPFHQACSSISINSQVIVNGIERATEVDDQKMTALHILCTNPHVMGDTIRAYLQLASEAADQEDSEGMTPFQYLSMNDIAFLEEERSFSFLMAWWYGCMP